MAYSNCPVLSHTKQNSLLVKQRTVTGGQAVQRKRCATFCPVSKVSLVRPVAVENSKHKPLLLYLPGTDGTGNSIIPQLPGLVGAGFDIRSLYITMDDRSSWDSLISQIIPLVRQLAQSNGQQQKLTVVAESFGGCLAFRLALAVPELITNMVVVNSATSFNKSYSGIINLIAASNLLSLFPEQLYQMAQAVLVPLLVCKEKVGPSSLRAIRSMMVMQPPPSFTVEQGQLGVEEPPAGAADQSRQSRDLYVPSATASWRMNMLTQGNLPDDSFRQIKTRVLLVGSGEDRLLPSLTEQTRLQRLLPNAQRLVLPDSGHTALLEADVDLVSIMARTGFLPSDAHHQKGSANVISQWGSQVGQVNPGTTPPASSAALQNEDTSRGGWQATPTSSTAGTAASRQRKALSSSSNGSSSGNGSSLGQVSGRQSTLQLPKQTVTNESSSNKINIVKANGSQSAASQATANGNDAAAAASTSSTDTVEGWVSDNLSNFLADPDSGPDLPGLSTQKAPSQPQRAAFQSQKVAGPTQKAGSNGLGTPPPRTDSAPSPSTQQQQQQQQVVQEVQQLQQQQQSQQQQWQQQQEQQTGGNGTSKAAQQSWGSVKQKGPAGAWQGQGQGPSGGSGGSWATVDDNMENARWLLSPWRALVAPVVKGVENLPDPLGPRRPLLFIGNHTLIGLYDLPLLVHELYLRGYRVRGLAHPGHWKTPLGPLFQNLGAVKASPMAAYRLLQDAQAVLLFPGGGREVNKRKGEEYKLIWKDKPDFVRMAAKTNALIIPFAAVGGDDAFDVAMDTDEVLSNPVLGPLARRLAKQVFKGTPLEDSDDAISPVTKLPGLGVPSLLPLPKLERLYFRFMMPVDAQAALPDRTDNAAADVVYRQIKATVQEGIRQAQADREMDPERQLGKRLLGQIQRVVPSWELLKD
ncbi:TPA: hypothetical protein ACH3X3_009263 [Trebouxia sp. C0006]